MRQIYRFSSEHDRHAADAVSGCAPLKRSMLDNGATVGAKKRVSVLRFPYVCPEPVLAK
jgi:hypothetical protein